MARPWERRCSQSVDAGELAELQGQEKSYSELIIALEKIIVDKVSTAPSSKNRRNDTSAPMEIGICSERRWRECDPRRRPEEHASRSAGCIQRNWQRTVGFWQRPELE